MLNMELIQFIGCDGYFIGLYSYKKTLQQSSHQDNFDRCIKICKEKEDAYYSLHNDPDDLFDFKSELNILLEEAGYIRVFVEEVFTNYL